MAETPAPLLCFPDPPGRELIQAIEIGGYRWRTSPARRVIGPANSDELPEGGTPGDTLEIKPGDYSAAVVSLGSESDHGPNDAWKFCAELRSAMDPPLGVLVVVPNQLLSELEGRFEVFDDFCLAPFHPVELELRLAKIFAASGAAPVGVPDEIVSYGPLALNLETYQAVLDGRSLDLHLHGV